MKAREIAPLLPMSIKVKPYCHQVEAFNFVCQRLGLVLKGGESAEESEDQVSRVRRSLLEARKPSP